MKLISCFTLSACGLWMAMAGVSAWASPQQTPPVTSINAEKLLAKAARYRSLADEMNREADRRANINAALYQKFPRPVDAARSLATYYSQMAALLEAQSLPIQ